MTLKRFLLGIAATTVLLIGSSTPASAQRGRTVIGLETGYASLNTSAYAGVYLRYSFSRVFALRPQFDFVIRHHGRDAFMFNIDSNICVPLRNQRYSVYGILGAGFTSWNYLNSEDEAVPGHERYAAIGFDVGAGASMDVTPTLRLALEVKGNLVARRSTALAGISIGYIF